MLPSIDAHPVRRAPCTLAARLVAASVILVALARDRSGLFVVPLLFALVVPFAQGLTNSEIAARLGLGDATAKTHVSNVIAKLGVHDRVQAAIRAYEAGLAGATRRISARGPSRGPQRHAG